MVTLTCEEKLAGIIERITFHSDESGWSVLKISPFDNPGKLVTVVAHQVKVFAGATVELHGSWTHHAKYGDQFKASRIIEKKPASAAALEKYLGSGLIKGVGPATAKKIVKFFGDRTLDVFENKIDDLLAVPTIAEKKLEMIKTSWEEHRAIRDVMIFLQSYGVSTLFAVKIYKKYGNEAINIVSQNPYQLARDIYGIGFFSADRIALSMGFTKDGPERIKAGIKHVLAASRENGHCYLIKEQILEQANSLLNLNVSENILTNLNDLAAKSEIKTRLLPPQQLCYYANSLYWDEEVVAKKVTQLIKTGHNIDQIKIASWIDAFCRSSKLQLSEQQQASILGIVSNSFSILTGGPGCGKTTTTKILVQLLKKMGKRLMLAAPTGRAAQRMHEVIGLSAKTIHRLLEWDPRQNCFKRNEESQLDTDFLIIDECSMLDISLAASLLRAVPSQAQVLFIGDPDQLPSVGAGNVLRDLLTVSFIKRFQLTKIFRQAEQSSIIRFAHDINKAHIPQIVSPIADKNAWKKSDCLFIDSDEASQEQLRFLNRAKQVITKTLATTESVIVKTNEQIIGKMAAVDGTLAFDRDFDNGDHYIDNMEAFIIPKKFQNIDLAKLANTSKEIDEIKMIIGKIHPWSTLHYGMTAVESIVRLYQKTIPEMYNSGCEIQVLSPQVRGSLGTLNLNRVLQGVLNPPITGTYQIKIGEKFFRPGDRVIQTRNNYDLEVFNGDIGRIKTICPEDSSCVVAFTGETLREVVYSREDLIELSLAYAITIHKAQGSEFGAVIIPLSTQHFKMMFRNLIYTGLTRAKKLAIFVGSRKALAMSIKNIDSRERQTSLRYILEQAM